jgi:cytoskeleton protein RodZ
MTVGAELAEARQSLGLSLDEVSARTKISVERLSAIEQMDTAQLPSLVYLKGFLRAYAVEVQLDPDDIAQRYLSEVEIAPPDLSALGSVSGAPAPPGERVLERADDWQAEFLPENPPASEVPLAAPEPEATVSPAGRYFAVVNPRELSSSPAISRPSPMRYAAIVMVLAIAAAAGWALSANFDSIAGRFKQARPVTQKPPADEVPSPTPNDRATAPEPATPVVPSDSRPAAGNTETATKSDAVPVNAPSDSNVTTARAAAAATEPIADADASTNLSGPWALTNRVESSSYEGFNNLNLGFHLQLQQRGNRVTGTGQKWMENGRAIPPPSRTPIAVEGTLDGRRLELTFTERGARRTSAGTFVMDVADDGTLRGTFTSDAAKSQGTSLARRMTSPHR